MQLLSTQLPLGTGLSRATLKQQAAPVKAATPCLRLRENRLKSVKPWSSVVPSAAQVEEAKASKQFGVFRLS